MDSDVVGVEALLHLSVTRSGAGEAI